MHLNLIWQCSQPEPEFKKQTGSGFEDFNAVDLHEAPNMQFWLFAQPTHSVNVINSCVFTISCFRFIPTSLNLRKIVKQLFSDFFILVSSPLVYYNVFSPFSTILFYRHQIFHISKIHHYEENIRITEIRSFITLMPRHSII